MLLPHPCLALCHFLSGTPSFYVWKPTCVWYPIPCLNPIPCLDPHPFTGNPSPVWNSIPCLESTLTGTHLLSGTPSLSGIPPLVLTSPPLYHQCPHPSGLYCPIWPLTAPSPNLVPGCLHLELLSLSPSSCPHHP